MRDWKMNFTGPDPTKFSVTSVVSANPGAMTATYTSATNTIATKTSTNTH